MSTVTPMLYFAAGLAIALTLLLGTICFWIRRLAKRARKTHFEIKETDNV